VFLGTIIFVGIFFGFTMFDLKSRDALNDEQETFVRLRELENAGQGLKVGVENVPDRKAKVMAEIEAHGGGHGGGDAHGGGHGGGDHGPAKAEQHGAGEHKAAH
jgi:hypothetical protein